MTPPGRAPRRRANTPFFGLGAVRRSHGISQQAMADRLGLDRKTLSKYETGKLRIPSPLLVRMLEAYGLSATDVHWGLPGDLVEDDEPDLPMAVGQ